MVIPWGLKDGQWCGFDEATFNSNVRIRNKKKKKKKKKKKE